MPAFPVVRKHETECGTQRARARKRTLHVVGRHLQQRAEEQPLLEADAARPVDVELREEGRGRLRAARRGLAGQRARAHDLRPARRVDRHHAAHHVGGRHRKAAVGVAAGGKVVKDLLRGRVLADALLVGEEGAAALIEAEEVPGGVVAGQRRRGGGGRLGERGGRGEGGGSGGEGGGGGGGRPARRAGRRGRGHAAGGGGGRPGVGPRRAQRAEESAPQHCGRHRAGCATTGAAAEIKDSSRGGRCWRARALQVGMLLPNASVHSADSSRLFFRRFFRDHVGDDRLGPARSSALRPCGAAPAIHRGV
jgi:hypothetical protein